MNAALALTMFNPGLAMHELFGRWWIMLAGITTALCTSFKVELMKAIHDFTAGGDVFKMALFKAQAAIVGTYDSTTTSYNTMTGNNDELANGNGYATGGVTVANTTPASAGGTGLVAYTTPNGNFVWAAATFTTRGAMYYNSSKANRAVFCYDFGADEPVVSGTLTLTVPANDSTHALIRFN